MPVVINNIGNYPDGKLTVDPTSKAMRIISYDSAGDCIDNVADGFPEFGGSFIAPWENRSTAANATSVSSFVIIGATNETRTAVRAIRGAFGFDGTGLTASGAQRLGLYRARGYQGLLAGVVFKSSPNKDYTDSGFSSSYVRQVLAGTTLTVTDLQLEADALHVFAIPSVATQVAAVATSADKGMTIEVDLDYRDSPIWLGAGEMLIIKIQTSAAIIGQSFCGSIDWSEE